MTLTSPFNPHIQQGLLNIDLHDRVEASEVVLSNFWWQMAGTLTGVWDWTPDALAAPFLTSDWVTDVLE